MSDTGNDRKNVDRVSETLRTFKRTFDSTEIVEQATSDLFDSNGFDAPWETKFQPEEITRGQSKGTFTEC